MKIQKFPVEGSSQNSPHLLQYYSQIFPKFEIFGSFIKALFPTNGALDSEKATKAEHAQKPYQ
jgi:hypothetical protein